MKKIISQNQDFKTFKVDFDEARDILAQMDEAFKCELVDKIQSGDFKNSEKLSDKISFYFNVSKGKSNNEDVQNFLTQQSFETFEELDGDQIKTLKFIDMCTGPHVENTRELDVSSALSRWKPGAPRARPNPAPRRARQGQGTPAR